MEETSGIERLHSLHQRIFGRLGQQLDALMTAEVFVSLCGVACFSVSESQGIVGCCVVLRYLAGPPAGLNGACPVPASGPSSTEAEVRGSQARCCLDGLLVQSVPLL